MARARVVLKDQPGCPKSIDIRGLHFEGNTAHVITDAADIKAFSVDPTFICEMLDGEPTAPPKSSPEASDEDDDEAELDADDELSDEKVQKLSKKQLVEIAKERGVEDVEVGMKKDDIIAKIRSANKE